MSRKEYIAWVTNPSNGLCKSKVVGDFKFTLQYKPLDYVALTEVSGHQISSGAFDSIKSKYEGLQYFELTIDPATGSQNVLKYKTNDASDYYNNLNYYSFRMKDDLALLCDTTVADCILFNFDNSHDLSKHSTAVFAFENPKGNAVVDKIIRYRADRLGLGFIKIAISASDIKSIPPINLNEL